MPRNAARRWPVAAAAVAAAACSFDAAYQSGHTTCSDGRCPSGLVCSADHVCVTPGSDASVGDGAAGSDAHVAALTCGDPGLLTSGVPVTGTTMGRPNMVSASCDGAFANGPDAIYAITATAGQPLELALAGSNELVAYALATCTSGTPPCIGNVYATANGTALAVTAGSAGPTYVIVDSVLANGSGSYTLAVTAE